MLHLHEMLTKNFLRQGKRNIASPAQRVAKPVQSAKRTTPGAGGWFPSEQIGLISRRAAAEAAANQIYRASAWAAYQVTPPPVLAGVAANQIRQRAWRRMRRTAGAWTPWWKFWSWTASVFRVVGLSAAPCLTVCCFSAWLVSCSELYRFYLSS